MSISHISHDQNTEPSALARSQRSFTARHLLSRRAIAISLSVLLSVACSASVALGYEGEEKRDGKRNIESKSVLLKKSASVKTGEKMPFFSGWLSNGRVLSLPLLLKRQKKRYVITMCAEWCKLCYKGLKEITEAQSRFKEKGIDVVIYIADREEQAKKLIKELNLDWTDVLIDEFSRQAGKLAEGSESEGKSTLELPRTFVLNNKGVVEMIIGGEGGDYIPLLLGEVKP